MAAEFHAGKQTRRVVCGHLPRGMIYFRLRSLLLTMPGYTRALSREDVAMFTRSPFAFHFLVRAAGAVHAVVFNFSVELRRWKRKHVPKPNQSARDCLNDERAEGKKVRVSEDDDISPGSA